MKELSIEEKAKRYDEAIERARLINNKGTWVRCGSTGPSICEQIFPELKESEDERIKKELIEFVKSRGGFKQEYIAWLEKQGEHANFRNKIQIGDKVTRNEDGMLVNLSQLNRVAKKDEKQGEQKSREEVVDNLHNYLYGEQNPAWSEEDERMLDEMYKFFDTQNITSLKHYMDNYAKFIKSLKDRVQPVQEWSEEDERSKNVAIQACKYMVDNFENSTKQYDDAINWLKSLRPQNWTKEDKERYISCLQRLGTGNPEQPETINSKWFKEHVYPQSTWKPSDEQMKLLREVQQALLGKDCHNRFVNFMYELKRLREE